MPSYVQPMPPTYKHPAAHPGVPYQAQSFASGMPQPPVPYMHQQAYPQQQPTYPDPHETGGEAAETDAYNSGPNFLPNQSSNVIAYQLYPDEQLIQCVHRINTKFAEMKEEIVNIRVDQNNAEQVMEKFKA